jgi:hypothetical protein
MFCDSYSNLCLLKNLINLKHKNVFFGHKNWLMNKLDIYTSVELFTSYLSMVCHRDRTSVKLLLNGKTHFLFLYMPKQLNFLMMSNCKDDWNMFLQPMTALPRNILTRFASVWAFLLSTNKQLLPSLCLMY